MTAETTQTTYKWLKQESQITADRATIVITTPVGTGPTAMPEAIERLNDAKARHFALAIAAQEGINKPGISGKGSPYAVNAAGVNVFSTDIKGPNGEELPPDHPDKQPAAYRVAIRVSRGL